MSNSDPQPLSEDESPLELSSDMLSSEPPPPVKRPDFERGMRVAPPLSLVLIVINVAIFAWQLAADTLQSEAAIIGAGALHRQSVLDGDIWRVVTAVFLHGSIDHLLGNCLVLYILGMALEHAIGITGAGIVYAASGLGGSILSVTMSPGPSVGASGAIFGLLGAVIVFFLRFHSRYALRNREIGIVLLIWAVWQVGIGFLSPQIDNWAHIGGFVAGAVVGAILRPRLRETKAFGVLPAR